MSDFFVFIATGKDRAFTSLATTHVADFREKLKARKHKPDSMISLPARVRFVHFKFETKEILLNDQTFSATKNGNEAITWKPLPSDLPISKSASPDVSIVDVYHAVRNVPPHTVLEVDFFSHGFLEGPELKNTDDNYDRDPPIANTNYRKGFPKRDPNDRDGRVRTDFSPNMGEDPDVKGQGLSKDGTTNALTEFQNGFAPKAAFRVYGCDLQTVLRINNVSQFFRSTVMQVIRQAYNLKVGKGDTLARQLLRKEKPTTPIDLDMGQAARDEASIPLEPDDPPHPYTTPQECRDLHYLSDPVFFAGAKGNDVISRPIRDVIRFVANQVSRGYIFAAADASFNYTCFGALPGTSADLSKADPKHRMLVDPKTWGPYLKFYKAYLDISSHEDNAVLQRHYGIFDKAAVQSIKDHAING